MKGKLHILPQWFIIGRGYQATCVRGFSVGTTSCDTKGRFSSPTDVNIHKHKLSRAKMQGLQGSLIPETLREMEMSQQEVAEDRPEKEISSQTSGIAAFSSRPDCAQLRKRDIKTLQLNIGLYCNQACSHCHVESSPKKVSQVMSRETARRCLDLLSKSESVTTVDITGGAPELCPEFRFLVDGATRLNKHVIDRCNLTALLEPGQEDTPSYLAKNKVQVIASLPCYSPKNVNLQRGSGVFQRSIAALQLLNDQGYGVGDSNSDLQLNLVYNPLGAFLPPDQTILQAKYKEELFENFGIRFNNLYTLTNMPIKRFEFFLARRNELKDYMQLLADHFNPGTLDGLMCRNSVSVDYQGFFYDCDFNQQLNLTPRSSKSGRNHIQNLATFDDLSNADITFGQHCYGCTAGSGST